MALRGRKPIPTALKRLEGNPGKRPYNEAEPIPPNRAVTCPAWLLPEAKTAWNRIAPLLIGLGLLTFLDITPLAGYCQAYARWKDAKEQVFQDGTQITSEAGKLQQNPYLAIESKNLSVMRSLSRDFGFKHEMFLAIITDGEPSADAAHSDPMERLLKGGWNHGV